ncbi:YheC/YheD family endospore coat-associated protein [Risungbinella massiliensis]|uniref:YheC/YheD family endospore coat-associated protein n=1 Tax=Risungbinella massiliensis TaxID=1329796 RepID=UPI000699DE93|nr:YheC/YheD family protein [Risungbinella massiliensis]
MGIAKIQIKILPDHVFPRDVNVLMSRPLVQMLGLVNAPFWITFGSAAETGYFAVTSDRSMVLRVRAQLATRLHLPNTLNLHAQYDINSRHLQLGPMLGIMIDPTPLHDQPTFGNTGKFLEECCQAGMQQGIYLIIFPPEKVSLEKQTIQGWTYMKGKWQRNTVPFPNAIYNRILSRKQEQITSVQTILQRLMRNHRIPIFNEKFLNKQEVYDVLSTDEIMKSMLPETHHFQTSKLKEMVQKYSTLFLKPTNGSLGGGIIRVTRSAPTWIVQSTTNTGILTRKFSKFVELKRALVGRIGKQKYLIQQGLSLILFQKRPVDFRVLVQKNRQGQWSITSSVGRIANDQQIVSNLARGGTIRKANELLSELEIPSKPSIQQIRNAALLIAETFEKKAAGHFAELGIDLGVDHNGKIWLIEINSKPSKSDDSIVANPNMITRPSVKKLLDYTLYLSGVSQTRVPKKKVSKRRLRR